LSAWASGCSTKIAVRSAGTKYCIILNIDHAILSYSALTLSYPCFISPCKQFQWTLELRSLYRMVILILFHFPLWKLSKSKWRICVVVGIELGQKST
jgi:hypothetical protein